jgi:hypothetical protein
LKPDGRKTADARTFLDQLGLEYSNESASMEGDIGGGFEGSSKNSRTLSVKMLLRMI